MLLLPTFFIANDTTNQDIKQDLCDIIIFIKIIYFIEPVLGHHSFSCCNLQRAHDFNFGIIISFILHYIQSAADL
jgi:hypothetical protein